PRAIIVASSPWHANKIANVHDNVRNNVRNNVVNNVYDNVADNVRNNVYNNVRNNVADNVRNNVAANVYNNVYDNVYNNVAANVSDKYFYPSWAADCGWSGLAAYADFFTRIGLEFSESTSFWLRYRRESGAWYAICQSSRMIVSEAPCLLRRDDEGRLHCETGPAIAWRDMYAVFSWHGVTVPGEWIVNRATLTAQEVLTETNLEKRRAGCEIIGWAKVINQLGGKVIDEDHPQIGKLIECELPDSGTERFLFVKCGTGREFALCVDRDVKTAYEANLSTYPQLATLGLPVETIRNAMINNRS
ncbi:MAG: hypothetical protein NW202_13585, partial [Nitrospira sp.]|nr:hypothetical protein [Nitrospira sp.]